MKIRYQKRIPYPFENVLSQYFDLEHFETVHPRTLGECKLLEVEGNRILFEQRWPAWLGVRCRSTVEQLYMPPDRIRFHFAKGLYKGVKVFTHLADGGQFTDIDEVYQLPWLPDWGWLRVLIRPWVRRSVERIWREDLDVGLCHGGWPGVPGQDLEKTADDEPPRRSSLRWVRVAERSELSDLQPRVVNVEGQEIVLWSQRGSLYALGNRCPHSGGPLSLGWVQDGCLVCPWHGARFRLQDGSVCGPPATKGVLSYPLRRQGHAVMIAVNVGDGLRRPSAAKETT